MAARHRHHRLELGTRKGTAQHGHSSLAVDHCGDPKLFVRIAGLAKAAYSCARSRGIAGPGKQFARTRQKSGQRADASEKTAAIPPRIESHNVPLFVPYLRVTAAMQLISSNEW